MFYYWCCRVILTVTHFDSLYLYKVSFLEATGTQKHKPLFNIALKEKNIDSYMLYYSRCHNVVVLQEYVV